MLIYRETTINKDNYSYWNNEITGMKLLETRLLSFSYKEVQEA